MALWEFTLAFDDGTVLGQTALGDGVDEAAAAASTARAVAEHPGLVLHRPGRPVASDVEARWREIYDDRFPQIVNESGRLSLYARGIPDPSRAPSSAPVKALANPGLRVSRATRRAVRRSVAGGQWSSLYEMTSAIDGGQSYEMRCKICGEFGNIMASEFRHHAACPVAQEEKGASAPAPTWWRRLLARFGSDRW